VLRHLVSILQKFCEYSPGLFAKASMTKKVLYNVDPRLTVPDSLFRLSAMPGLTTLILSGNDLANITSQTKKSSSKNVTSFTGFGSLPQIEHLEIENCNLVPNL
jgi:hypothetical protein